jgi:hypothetical protein
MVVNRILAFAVPVLVGGMIGAILGGIITGSEGYFIMWGIGLPIVIIAGVALAAVGSDAAKKTRAAQSGKPTGINQSVITPEVVSSVLNANSTAVPSTGVVLNGEPMSATAKAVPASGANRPVRLRRGIAFVLVLAGAALALIPAYTMIGWIASDTVHGQPFSGRDMRTGLHLNDAVAQIADVVGSPDMTRVGFYEDYVIATARTSPRSTTVDSYMWRYGVAFRQGPGGFEPELSALLFDTSTIDFSIIPGLITIAKRDAGMNDADSYYPSVSRASGAEGPGDPVITISLSDDYFDAYYTFSLDGEIISKSGSAFE